MRTAAEMLRGTSSDLGNEEEAPWERLYHLLYQGILRKH